MLTTTKISQTIAHLHSGYRRLYPERSPDYINELCVVAETCLQTISQSDALYHNLDHTILVTLTGQAILAGKHLLEEVTCEDWFHCMIALLCHDIGYVRGICSQDQGERGLYTTATPSGLVYLPSGTTDASLAPYHVDRGKLYVEELFRSHPLIHPAMIQAAIESTRFPVPASASYQDTCPYASLVRAADLIGQLADSAYLQKIPALFYEFQETGATKSLGFRHPGEMLARFPAFYYRDVYPHVQDGLRYLGATLKGKQIIAQLQANLANAERKLASCAA